MLETTGARRGEVPRREEWFCKRLHLEPAESSQHDLALEVICKRRCSVKHCYIGFCFILSSGPSER